MESAICCTAYPSYDKYTYKSQQDFAWYSSFTDVLHPYLTLQSWQKEQLISKSLLRLILLINQLGAFFLVYLYLSISACFGLLWAHHQEIHLCLCDTWYLFFCMDDCLVCRGPTGTLHTRQSSVQKNKNHVSHKHSCISWWRACLVELCIPDSHIYTKTSTTCHINTVVSPDDGPIHWTLHTRQSYIHKNKYHVSHTQLYLLMMGPQQPETCRDWQTQIY